MLKTEAEFLWADRAANELGALEESNPKGEHNREISDKIEELRGMLWGLIEDSPATGPAAIAAKLRYIYAVGDDYPVEEGMHVVTELMRHIFLTAKLPETIGPGPAPASPT